MIRRLAIGLLCLSLIPGCAELNTKTGSTVAGAGIGCAAGAVVAKLTSNNAAAGCAVGAVAGGAIGYLRVRNAEVEEAKKTTEAVQKVPGATAAPVETQNVQVVDKETHKTETVAAFKSISVEIPVSQLNTPEGKDAIRKLEEYARKTADQRGETIDMTVANAPAKGARAVKVALNETIEAAGNGKVRRTQIADPKVPTFVQRITIEAKNQNRVEV